MDIFREILSADERIRSHVLKTPLLFSDALSELTGARVFLKLESEQHTGSFKARGATNKILTLSPEEKKRGVVTASTGNHGKAVARALSLFDCQGILFLPENVDQTKAKTLEEYGSVEIRYHGTGGVDHELFAKKFAAEQGMTWISPYNDPQVIGGQGTVGIELAEQLETIDAVFITVGGGGLISGAGTYLKRKFPEISIIATLPENSPEMYLSVQANRIVSVEPKETLSDSSAGGPEAGSITFPICKELVDEWALVPESEIKAAMKLVFERHQKIIEGAAGVAVAAFLKNKEYFVNKNVAIIICGGNIAPEKFRALFP